MSNVKSSSDKVRSSNWTFIVYPDSAPEFWRSMLDNYHVPWVESPLHQYDINPDGTIKKAHWHVLIMFSSLKSYNQVLEITELLNAPVPQVCHSNKGLIRYMCHLDNPEKYQYNLTDVVCHQGADIGELLLPTQTEQINMMREILLFIHDNELTEFSDLVYYALEHKFDTWFPFLMRGNTIFLSAVFRSLRGKEIK